MALRAVPDVRNDADLVAQVSPATAGLYRGLLVGSHVEWLLAAADWKSAIQQTEKSALRGQLRGCADIFTKTGSSTRQTLSARIR